MPDYDSGETIPFILDIPRDKIEELKQALEGLEIKFAPENQVVAFNDAIRSQPMAMGHHIPEMVLSINWTLDEDGLTPGYPRTTRGGARCAARHSCSSPCTTSTGTTT